MQSVAKSNELMDMQKLPHRDMNGERICRTIPLVGTFATCLMHDSHCQYAVQCGFTYLCMKPRFDEASNQSH